MVWDIAKTLRDIAKLFARYRKPTSGSEFNFRSEEQLTTTMEFGRFMDVYFELGLRKGVQSGEKEKRRKERQAVR